MSPLLSAEARARMLANGRRRIADPDFDPQPAALIVAFHSRARWLLTELHPNNPDIAFGVCDLGFGHPALGSVRLSEIRNYFPWHYMIPEGMFEPKAPLSAYARASFKAGYITEIIEGAA